MAGELTGSIEAIYFSDRMGLANLGSFYLWILSILVFAGTLFYHFAIFAPNGWTLLVGGGTIVVMTILWIWIPLKQQKRIFDCKYLACTCTLHGLGTPHTLHRLAALPRCSCR
eukprot:1948804-Prymnesium_polylepis.3